MPGPYMPGSSDRLPATTLGAELVVSWNFKHIVHFEKIAGYEGVNSLRGYRSPKIYSPREVVKN